MSGDSPISFQVNINRLPAKGMPVEIDADEEARTALAEAHGLQSVASLVASLTVSNWKRDGIAVSGRVRAAVVQSCVVSLEPIDAEVDEAIDALFLPKNSKLAKYQDDPSGELLIDPDGPDAPELFEGDTIDVGALVEEVFAVGLDPYPRKAGAGPATYGDEAPAKPAGPLAEQLAALKART